MCNTGLCVVYCLCHATNIDRLMCNPTQYCVWLDKVGSFARWRWVFGPVGLCRVQDDCCVYVVAIESGQLCKTIVVYCQHIRRIARDMGSWYVVPR